MLTVCRDPVAVVIVTYNRADLLSMTLDAVLAQKKVQIGKIFVIDNASSDHTQQVIAAKNTALIESVYSEHNLGGAGGFNLGARRAFAAGYAWLWLMDDDVLPDAYCLRYLLEYKDLPVLMPARENKQGELAEYSALEYNLSNPFYIQPKRRQVTDMYPSRAALPACLKLANFSFEGVLLKREVVDKVGFPYAEYFIAADDVDYAERIKKAGFKIYLIRDAKLVRQLPFNQKEALRSWKGYYMYRNIFVIHFLYGTNFLVRLKPYVLLFGARLTGKFRRQPNLSRHLLADAKKIAGILQKKPPPGGSGDI